MRRRGAIVDTLLKVRAIYNRMQTRFGPFPKPGINAATGLPEPDGRGTTLRQCDAIRHPTLTRWAFVIDAATEAELTEAERALIADLLDEWDAANRIPD